MHLGCFNFMESSILINIIFFEAILVFVNLPAFLLGLKFEGNSSAKRLWFEPAGIMIPIVWIVLFGLLATLQSKLFGMDMSEMAFNVFTLALVCAMYPYYTLGLEKATGISAIKFGLLGNGLILMVSLWLASQVGQISPQLAYFVFPLVVWTAYTTFVLIGRIRLMRGVSID